MARLQKQTFGAVNVIVTALEREEGVEILAARGPKQCVIEGGEVKCLETVMRATTPDANGRKAPGRAGYLFPRPLLGGDTLPHHRTVPFVSAVCSAPRLRPLSHAFRD